MNNTITTTPSLTQLKEYARADAKEVIKRVPHYLTLSIDEQKSLYFDLVNENLKKQKEKYGLSKSMATDSGKDMGYRGYDPAFQGDTQAFRELVDSVDFPKFVADLLKAVFDANLKVMKQQTDAYIKLLKEATKDVAQFLKQVKDDDVYTRMAQTKSDRYNITQEKQADGSSKLVLTDSNGEKVDTEDSKIKAEIMHMKLLAAQEHQTTLKQIIMMGIARMVVDKGEIEASVDFSIKATRESKAHHEDQNINVTTIQNEYDSPLGGLFGGPSGSFESTNTNIQVNTSDKKATDDLSAKLHGKVNIQFSTQYFDLNKFADMYAPNAAGPKPGTSGVAGQTPTGLLPAATR